MTNQPTTQDLLLLEVRGLVASVGELRLQLNGVWQRVTALEGRVKNLESGSTWMDDADRSAKIDTKITRELKELWKLGMEHDRRLSALEAKAIDIDRPWAMTGSIQGLEGEFTITPPPEWYT